MSDKLSIEIDQTASPITYAISFKNVPDELNIPVSPKGIYEFYIIEDLEQAFRTGHIIFKDTNYLHEYMPFTGNERVEIEISQKEAKKTKTIESSSRNLQYLLFFCR